MQWYTVTSELIDSKGSGNKMDMVLNDSSSRKGGAVLQINWATPNIKFL